MKNVFANICSAIYLRNNTRIAVVSVIVTVFVACSVLKSEDPDKKVREYLASFQASLTKPDNDILEQFRVKQSKEATLLVIGILQNKDPFIVCETDISTSRITRSNNVVYIEIPVTYTTKELSSQDSIKTMLAITLTPQGDTYVITQLDGETFYQQFQTIRNRNLWEAKIQKAIQDRTWVYETAKKLETEFDSVIWYTYYNNQNYFYVTEGQWQNYFLSYNTQKEKNEHVKMGLVSSTGEVIIPVEYDLIGTLAFIDQDLVEVIQNNKIGYFNIKTRQLVVEPVYEKIIPYQGENAWAVVKRDSIYGWLNEEFVFQPGFTSPKMEQWLNNFDYLKRTIYMKPGHYNYCEIPLEKYAGNGIIIPPAYLSEIGIFDPIEGGLNTAEVPVSAWTEYKETRGSFLQTITASLKAVVTTIRERYLEGREEFYTSSTITFVDNTNTLIGSSAISGEGATLNMIDSTLLEVRTPHSYWFMEEEASEETNLLRHQYFSITPDKKVTELTSNRLYPQTQYVKLDSSYLTGNFTVFNPGTGRDQTSTFLSKETITYMRNEILASYGYVFAEEETNRYFHHLREKGSILYEQLEDVESLMSEIDHYNYVFLNKILSYLQPASL